MHSDNSKYNYGCGRNINILNTFDGDHRVLNGLCRVMDILYNVLINLYRVLDILYHVLNILYDVLNILYRVLNILYRVMDILYDVLINLYCVLDILYRVLHNLYRKTDILYHLLHFETFLKSNHQMMYTILNKIINYLKPKYSINLISILKPNYYEQV